MLCAKMWASEQLATGRSSWASPHSALGSSQKNRKSDGENMSDQPLVRFNVDDGIGIITIDNPPVNAIGPGVRESLVDALEKGEADPNVKAMVMIGAGRSFIAGADIRQFGKPRVRPRDGPSMTCWTAAASRLSPRFMATPWAAAWKSPLHATTALLFTAPRSDCRKC